MRATNSALLGSPRSGTSHNGFCRVRVSNIELWLGAVLVLYNNFCRVRVSNIGLWLGAVLVLYGQ
jgi:hypothetical protein